MPPSVGLLRRCHLSVRPSSSTPKLKQTFSFLGLRAGLFFASCCSLLSFVAVLNDFPFSSEKWFSGDEKGRQRRGISARTKRRKKRETKQVWTSTRRDSYLGSTRSKNQEVQEDGERGDLSEAGFFDSSFFSFFTMGNEQSGVETPGEDSSSSSVSSTNVSPVGHEGKEQMKKEEMTKPPGSPVKEIHATPHGEGEKQKEKEENEAEAKGAAAHANEASLPQQKEEELEKKVEKEEDMAKKAQSQEATPKRRESIRVANEHLSQSNPGGGEESRGNPGTGKKVEEEGLTRYLSGLGDFFRSETSAAVAATSGMMKNVGKMVSSKEKEEEETERKEIEEKGDAFLGNAVETEKEEHHQHHRHPHSSPASSMKRSDTTASEGGSLLSSLFSLSSFHRSSSSEEKAKEMKEEEETKKREKEIKDDAAFLGDAKVTEEKEKAEEVNAVKNYFSQSFEGVSSLFRSLSTDTTSFADHAGEKAAETKDNFQSYLSSSLEGVNNLWRGASIKGKDMIGIQDAETAAYKALKAKDAAVDSLGYAGQAISDASVAARTSLVSQDRKA